MLTVCVCECDSVCAVFILAAGPVPRVDEEIVVYVTFAFCMSILLDECLLYKILIVWEASHNSFMAELS